jgi:hypothetical protein
MITGMQSTLLRSGLRSESGIPLTTVLNFRKANKPSDLVTCVNLTVCGEMFFQKQQIKCGAPWKILGPPYGCL